MDIVSPALLAVMIAIAAPTAQGSFTLECEVTGYDGIAFAAETPPRVVLAPEHCRRIKRAIRYPRQVGFPAMVSLETLLHEARHIGQYREGFEGEGAARELDAECRAVAALGRVAYSLGVRRGVIRRAVRLLRWGIATTPPPYGGRC